MNLTFGMDLNLLIIIGANLLLTIILFFVNLSNRSKIRKLRAKYYRFMSGLSGANIEELLESCLDKLDETNQKNRELELQINKIERDMYHCVQKFGVVRYNAFDDVGSDMSFSIALLDNNDDGLVMSSLYARDSSSVYAKPIVKGSSKYALSAEELKAIDLAKKTSVTSKYTDHGMD